MNFSMYDHKAQKLTVLKNSWLCSQWVWSWSPVWNQSWNIGCFLATVQLSFSVKIETPSALSGRMEKKGPNRVNPGSPKDINAYAGYSSLFLLGCVVQLCQFSTWMKVRSGTISQSNSTSCQIQSARWEPKLGKLTAAWEAPFKLISLVLLHLRCEVWRRGDAETPGGPGGSRIVWWRFYKTDLLNCDYEAQIADPHSPVSANVITQVIKNKREEIILNIARSVHLKNDWDLMEMWWHVHHHTRGSNNGTMLSLSPGHYLITEKSKPCNKTKLFWNTPT